MTFHPGGFIEGTVMVSIHPDECLLAPTNINDPRSMRCIRRDHRHLRVARSVEPDPAGWHVTHSTFTTSDKDLAEAVRSELDCVDPVQGPLCRHAGDLISVRTLRDPRDLRHCQDCGATLAVEPDAGALRIVTL